MVKFAKPETVEKTLGIHGNTLRRWADSGKIKCIRLSKRGHRMYDIDSIQKLIGVSDEPPAQYQKDKAIIEPIDIAYCRVSSAKQKDDLERQVKYMQDLYPNHKIITDIGSGINFKRKGLRSILEDAFKGRVREVRVSHRDRLCRFGYDLIKWTLEQHGAKLMVLDDTKTSPQEEFTEDLLAIVTVFSCRFNGMRRYAHAAKKAVEGAVETDQDHGSDSESDDHTDQKDPIETDKVSNENNMQLDGGGPVHLQ